MNLIKSAYTRKKYVIKDDCYDEIFELNVEGTQLNKETLVVWFNGTNHFEAIVQ